jgi:hypothetical protein
MQFEKIMNTLYSFAAAVVIFGAWAKLEHKDYGSLALTVGLLTEVGIFFIYGLMEWGKDPAEQTQSPTQTASSSPPSDAVHTTPPPSTGAGQMDELTSTLKRINLILNKVFRTE